LVRGEAFGGLGKGLSGRHGWGEGCKKYCW